MASEFGPEWPAVRLSGKEVSGLAARVLVAALVPPGATGGTSEACEFLELTEGGALSRLDGEKEALLDVDWTTPGVVAETADAAIVNFGGRPAHHAGPAVADWLAAMALEHGRAAIAVEDVRSADLVAASVQLLARQGISCATLTAGEDGELRFRLVLAGGGSWVQYRWPVGSTPLPAGAGTDLDTLRGFAAAAVELADELSDPSSTVRAAGGNGNGPRCRALLVAFVREQTPRDEASHKSALRASGIEVMTSVAYAQLKSNVLAKGWPMDRPLWERMMAFADRSLIPTSERSRQGAG